MNTTAANTTSSNYQHTALRGILLGGFFAGLADFIYPTVKTVMAGGSWMQPWKGVASGLLGQQARDGGIEMVVLGASLHWFICFGAAALLYLIVSRVKWLPRQWIVLGIIHGIAVLLVMNYVILPLSAIGRSIYPLEQLHVHAFWHIVLVGLPTAFFVSRAIRASR
ncbi:MAG TPA: hypothetical protein VFS58_17210 [Steroidobacteraceae bacterium]|nr:hypothetical protein [Steroidobacteraceae bacterium]